ncbi:MAG: alpha/beta hydrolase, partial [Candidatus Pacebacteria bacterium]|nr:alpha/beta hydrolase [Candidatus Paceibacterota bacterium]
MKKVFIVHGYGGEPNGGWRPWLMGKLAKLDIWACALAMPNADNPKKDEWVKELNHLIKEPNEEIFLAGHSLGVPTLLRYVESLPEGSRIGGMVLVSGIIHKVPGKERYEPINHFYDSPFNFEYIKKVCDKFVVIHGSNDANVPFSQAEELSKELSC